jgi:aryl-alcohol dehydrogenase-like predicted oxidoreductase
MKYHLLGRSGLRVSEICLGTMTFGTEWGWGADYEESKRIFDTYAEAGGNFLDTANRYTEGTSERWLGEFIRSDRHHFVVATKYTLRDRMGDPNFCGNHRKNLMRSVEDSLRRLNTDFVDILWVHAWDGMTPVEEVMRGLDDLVRSGKVHYVGISDTPAWVVSHANTLAELRGWTAYTGLQIEYSLLQRAAEPGHVLLLVGGHLTGKYLKGEAGRVPETSTRRSERANRIAAEVVRIAEQLGVPAGHIAINWVRQRDPSLGVIPIVGARRAEQLRETLQCLNTSIPPEMLRQLDEVSAVELGFPHDFLASEGIREVVFAGQYHQIIR